ncbi:hypothetical protein IJX73_04385 [bacterium]|nr:hypothetical protein [bacterium]
MQQSNPLNSAISSNRAMYQQMTQPSIASNKAHLVNSYYGDKTQYYNDEVAIKKEQKRKISKIATIAFSVLAVAGILGNTYYQMARKHVNFGKLTNDVKDNFSKAIHFFMNMDMAKNNLWKSASEKISTNTPINTQKWFDVPIEKLYSFMGKFFNNRKYEKGVKVLQENNKVLKFDNLPQSGEYSKWFDEQSEIIAKRIKQANAHAIDVFKETFKKNSNEDVGFIGNAKNKLSKIWNESTQDIVEDRYLLDLYESQTISKTENYIKALGVDDEKLAILTDGSILNIFKKYKAKKEFIADIAKKLDGNCEIPNKAAKQVANSLLNIHKITSSGAREVLEKQRDIRLGNNSVEMLTNIGTLAALGLSISTSETKQEKKSKILNQGIPLATALGFSSVGGVLNIAGPKAAIIGLITGGLASKIAAKIDENIKKQALET